MQYISCLNVDTGDVEILFESDDGADVLIAQGFKDVPKEDLDAVVGLLNTHLHDSGW